MEFISRYALSCGSKIDVPYIYEKFFPLPIEKFITFHPVSKPAKTYDYFADVIEDLYPVLETHGIKIIQIGAAADHKFERCVKVCGMTTVNQVAYIVRRSLLHLSADTFSAHMAGAFDKKLVALYSSNYIQNSQPYWGKPEDQILLEPARLNGEKPSFAFDEHPKSINTIKSETISNAVFKLLGLTERANYETVFIGEKYQNQQYFHNIIPNNKGILVNQAETELRFDLNPNEDFLARQLNHAKSAIITDRPINLNLLKQLKPKISFLFYFVSSDNHTRTSV